MFTSISFDVFKNRAFERSRSAYVYS